LLKYKQLFNEQNIYYNVHLFVPQNTEIFTCNQLNFMTLSLFANPPLLF